MTIHQLARPSEVLRQKHPMVFRIVSCKMELTVSDDLKTVETQIRYELRKTIEGPNTWTEIFGRDDLPVDMKEVHNYRDDPLAAPLEHNDGRAFYNIDLAADISVGELYHLYVLYNQRTMLRLISRMFLHSQYLMMFRTSFANHCDLLTREIAFGKRCSLSQSIPPNEGDDDIFRNTRTNLVPNEVSMIALAINKGYLSQRSSYWITNMWWAVVGAIVAKAIQAIFWR